MSVSLDNPRPISVKYAQQFPRNFPHDLSIIDIFILVNAGEEIVPVAGGRGYNR
jgi:hypothetical protein